MPKDPTIDEIRRIRHEISREVGHDLHRLKNSFELLESQFKRLPVDHGGWRTIRSTGAAKSAELPVENLSPPRGG